ncbi:dihydrofolate reductase family protein [Halalkalibacter kiskunsagensis]|uniref:Dihydrofolate reductase family protein n=1 Tax=Halalkalibacter kiskunsagensis TaxID=1548599 RepID=A0ABV6KFY2_9BACI
MLYSFIEKKFVDELIITVAPTLIGKRIRLFKEGDYEIEYSLQGMKRFKQFVELHYKLKV